MARRKVTEVEQEEKEAAGETDMEEEGSDLGMDDFFDQEIDYGEIDELEKAMLVPEGHYLTAPPFTYKTEVSTVKVLVEEDGLEQEREIKRPVFAFWDGVYYEENGDKQFLGIRVSPRAVYVAGTGEERRNYLTPVSGARPDFASQFWAQAVKLYKRTTGEKPGRIMEVIEFLSNTPLMLTAKQSKPKEEGDPVYTNVKGFKLA